MIIRVMVILFLVILCANSQEKNKDAEKSIVLQSKNTIESYEKYLLQKGNMVKIKAGKFFMGSPSSEINRKDNEQQHEVVLTKDFWIGKYEVTQVEYEEIMGSNPSKVKGDRLPVVYVSWENALEYCRRLTSRERESGCLPDGYEYTLPTEAQWEYACRAGTTTAFAFGEMLWAKQANINEIPISLLKKSSPRKRGIMEVGSYKSNAWGIYDMHGNVWEWCLDFYGEYPKVRVVDPIGAPRGRDYVARGGGFNHFYFSSRSACRIAFSNLFTSIDFGFRVVLVERRKN